MRRITTRIGLGLVNLLVAAALLATCGSDGSPAQAYSQAGSAQPSDLASTGAASRRARRLRASTGCNSKREPFVSFRWRPARDRGRAQRVDYSEFFGGLSSGQFHKSPKLAPGRRRWRTANIETGIDYEWRVMTRRAHRWVSSAVRSFDGPLCL